MSQSFIWMTAGAVVLLLMAFFAARYRAGGQWQSGPRGTNAAAGGSPINVVGDWTLTMSVPMGPQVMQLHIARQEGDAFTGVIETPTGSLDISGLVTGGTLHWSMNVTKPMRIKLTFDVAVDGDKLSGTAKLGMFGNAPVTGHRLAAGEISPGSPVQAPAPPIQVTADFVDPRYNQPYIDVNELREDPAPHRYLHGGFTGTDARFSFYFPPKDRYEGRFFHNTYPLAASEDVGPFPIAFDVATGNLGFTFDSGAYYVQTNLGGDDRAGGMGDPAIAAYRVNAAAAKYSRIVAAGLYGDHRPYGYLFGGSGGSYQTLGSAENTSGVWDGFVPFVMATPNAIPSMFTVRTHALRVLKLRNKFPAIMDAINPGGSGDPYAELNDEERSALKEATLLGYPPRGWWNHDKLTGGYLEFVAFYMPMLDPSYIDDFWSKPGYLGSDANSSIHGARIQFETSVAKVIAAPKMQIELASIPKEDFTGADLIVLNGAAVGKSLPLGAVNGKVANLAASATPGILDGVQPGDHVRIDNSWALALQTYHRHQVPPTQDLYAWNQYRGADGQPLYPQRDTLIGPITAAATIGSHLNGKINGKMLVLECLMDIDAMPWQADWYRSKVKAALGPDFEDNFALWFIDYAQHDDPSTTAAHAQTVSYAGALQQALRDVSAWVEKGKRPSDTQYQVIDTQVHVPASAEQRKGIQPVVTLTANGGTRAEVAVNEPVTFTATIEVPPGAGQVVSAEWDFEGVGNYPDAARIDTPEALVRLSVTHAFTRPGTYFTVLRAASQRQGDAKTAYGRIQNIARVRVVVG